MAGNWAEAQLIIKQSFKIQLLFFVLCVVSLEVSRRKGVGDEKVVSGLQFSGFHTKHH